MKSRGGLFRGPPFAKRPKMAKRNSDVPVDDISSKRRKAPATGSGAKGTTTPLKPEVVLGLIHLGNLPQLKKHLEMYTPEQREELLILAKEWKCLHHVFGQRNADLLGFLLEEFDMDVNVENKEGLTMLRRAVRAGEEGLVKLLLNHGASVRKADRGLQWQGCGSSPLVHEAVEGDNPVILKLVLDAGADSERMVDMSGRFSLHLAAELDMADAFSVLISHGASLNQVDLQGRTALYYAARESATDTRITDIFLQGWKSVTCDTLEDYAAFFGGNVDRNRAEKVMGTFPPHLRALCYEFMGIGMARRGQNEQAVDMWSKSVALMKDHHVSTTLDATSLGQLLPGSKLRRGDELTEADLLLQAALRAVRLVPRSSFAVDTLCAVLLTGVFQGENTSQKKFILLTQALNIASMCGDRMDAERTLYDLFLKINPRAFAGGENNVFYMFLPLLIFTVNSLILDSKKRESEDNRRRHNIYGNAICKACVHLVLRLKVLLRLMSLFLDCKGEANEFHWKTFLDCVQQAVSHEPRVRQSTMLHMGYGVLGCEDFTPAVIKLLARACAHNVALSSGVKTSLLRLPDHLGRMPLHLFAERLPVDWLTKEGVLCCLLQAGGRLSDQDSRGKTAQDVLLLRGIGTDNLDPFGFAVR